MCPSLPSPWAPDGLLLHILLHPQLYAHNTTLGSSCGLDGAGKCGGPYSYNSLMVAVAVLLGSFMLCLVQRHVCWRWRVTGLMMGWEAQNSPQPEDQVRSTSFRCTLVAQLELLPVLCSTAQQVPNLCKFWLGDSNCCTACHPTA